MTLAPGEFIRRFLLHVLPNGFHRIRHYGLLASATCKANIARARELIAASVAVTDPPAEHDDPDLDVSAVEILPGARHRCEALTAPDGRPGRIHRAARGLGLKARDGAAARLRE